MQSKFVKVAKRKRPRSGGHANGSTNGTASDDGSADDNGGGSFEWREARFVFVVVFSHATLSVTVKEGRDLTMPKKPLHGAIAIQHVQQGDHERTLHLARSGAGSSGREEDGSAVRCFSL